MLSFIILYLGFYVYLLVLFFFFIFFFLRRNLPLNLALFFIIRFIRRYSNLWYLVYIFSLLWSGLLPSFLFYIKALLILEITPQLTLALSLLLFIFLFQLSLFYLQICYVTEQSFKLNSRFLKKLGSAISLEFIADKYYYYYFLCTFLFFNFLGFIFFADILIICLNLLY